MLLIPTTLAPSRLHGIGLFAASPVAAGAVVWRFNPAIDLRLSSALLENLALPAREQISSYVYLDNRTGELILCGDDARFFNHDFPPNVVDDPNDPYQCVAARDIAPEEELTHDYYSFDLLAAEKLNRR